MYPLLIISGEAGSGKDTVASLVAKHLHGQCVAQADPMKRLAKYLFGFSEEQLWGPSSARNAPDPRLVQDGGFVLKHLDRCGKALTSAPGETFHPTFVDDWLHDVLPHSKGSAHMAAGADLERWYDQVLEEVVKRGELTPRYVLQTLGTEWGRAFSKNMWVDYAIATAGKLLGGGYLYSRSRGCMPILETSVDKPPVNFVIITDGRFRNEVLAVKALGGQAWKVIDPSKALAQAAATAKAGVQGHASETEQQGIPEWWFDHVVYNNKVLGLERLEEALLRDEVDDPSENFVTIPGAISSLRPNPNDTTVTLKDF